jgi:hypothetical protein
MAEIDALTKIGILVALRKMGKPHGVRTNEQALEWALNRGYIIRNPVYAGIGSDDLALSDEGRTAIAKWWGENGQRRRDALLRRLRG